MKEIIIESIERLPEAAAQFISRFGEERPGVVAIEAPMGAGKTTFISEVVRQLGSADEASSPTFSIANIYDTERWGRVYHLDCYRLEDEEDAYETGVEDYFASGAPCFVEWPGRIEGLLPPDTLRVEIRVDEEGRRHLTFL